ncbi:MAG: hypothetical protein A3G81_25155 [Betaproteobacteria bacterium RIFCSPLOWO2_12_FULL_65_14]|nr:MAG: hypothetical protein A3G81_25155 [Betaproteobacteria bacterium RIFCSPLOWO2_12_FULL_65_14]
MAAAVAGALAAPGLAVAQSSVVIYGRANLGIDNYRATGATSPTGNVNGRMRVYDSGSRLGFRINEELGGGLRAFAVIETGINMDTGNTLGQSGSVNPNTAGWASRDSYVGVGGGWGDVRFGRQSIWWANGVIAQAGANYINVDAAILTILTGQVILPAARTSNTVSYNSPTMGGFNTSISYSPGGTEGAAYTGTGQTKDSIWGITGRYTTGALRAQIDWARRKNANPALTSPQENTGLKFGAGWSYAPGSQISAVMSRMENRNIAAVAAAQQNVAAGDSPKVRVTLLNWEHMLGQWQLIGQYAWTGKVSGLAAGGDNTRIKAYTLAAKYHLSKRTGVYASLSQIRNEARAIGDWGAGGQSSASLNGGPFALGSLTSASAGADPRIIAVGIMHNF